MFNKIIVLYFLMLSFISTLSFSQNINYLEFINNRKKFEKKYLRQAKHQIKKSLHKDNLYNIFSARFILKNVDFYVISMFTLKKEAEYFSGFDNFIKYIKINTHPLFHNVLMFKNEEYFGDYCYNDNGCCGIAQIVYNEKDFSLKRYLKQVKNFKRLNPEYIFYIRGILSAWWYIKDNEILVYYLKDEKVYNYRSFLEKYYSENKIRKIAKWNNTYPLVSIKK